MTKPFDSFVLKTFRRNVLENGAWPGEPAGGWLLPLGWYSEIRDIVRTSLVVRYLDGVRFLVDKLESVAKRHGVACVTSMEAKDWGYYAAHLLFEQPTEIPRLNWDSEVIDGYVELQVTTQLKDTIRTLTHKYYEERRERPAPEEKWQWDYQSEEFSANYLGHILHYVEGMIMDLRTKSASRSADEVTGRERGGVS